MNTSPSSFFLCVSSSAVHLRVIFFCFVLHFKIVFFLLRQKKTTTTHFGLFCLFSFCFVSFLVFLLLETVLILIGWISLLFRHRRHPQAPPPATSPSPIPHSPVPCPPKPRLLPPNRRQAPPTLLPSPPPPPPPSIDAYILYIYIYEYV